MSNNFFKMFAAYKFFLNSKYGWRNKYRDLGAKYGLDIDDYDDEDEFLIELDEIRYAWRNDYLHRTTYGVNPCDYTSKEEYEKPLTIAKNFPNYIDEEDEYCLGYNDDLEQRDIYDIEDKEL